MKTKIITLKSGKDVAFYFMESKNRWTSSYQNYLEQCTTFERLVDGTVERPAKWSRIYEFYSQSSTDNQEKIKRMIGESVSNIPKVFELVLTVMECRNKNKKKVK